MTVYLKKYWLSIVIILIIFILCFINTSPLPAPPVNNFDKWLHIIMILGISGVIFIDNTNHLKFSISRKRITWGSFVFPIAIGGLIEILQELFAPTRSGDWGDFLFDGIGAILGFIAVLLFNRYYLIKKHSLRFE